MSRQIPQSSAPSSGLPPYKERSGGEDRLSLPAMSMNLLKFLKLLTLVVAAIVAISAASGGAAYVCMETMCEDVRLCDELCQQEYPAGGATASCDPPLYLCCCKIH